MERNPECPFVFKEIINIKCRYLVKTLPNCSLDFVVFVDWIIKA